MNRTSLRPRRRSLLALLMIVALLAQRDASAHEGQPILVLDQQQTGPYTLTVFADPDLATGFLIMSIFVRPDPAARPQDPPVGTEVLISASPEALFSSEQLDVKAVQERGIPSTFRADLPFSSEGSWAVDVRISGAPGAGETSFTVIVGSESIWSARLLFPVIAIVGLLVISLISRREQRKAEHQRSS